MKKRIYHRLLLLTIVGIGLLAGCSSEGAKNQAAYRQAGIACMEQGDYANAVVAFEAALQQKVGSVGADEIDISYYKGAAQYANGDKDGAMATYQAILDFDKKQPDAYYLRGCLYLQQGNVEAAKADFASAVKYKSNEYELYLGIYENLASAGYIEEGEAYLNQAFGIKGDSPSQVEYRGRIYYLLGDYSSAITDLCAALEAGSKSAEFYLAKTYDAMGDDESAEEHYTKYLENHAQSADALGAMGTIMLEKMQYEKAVTYLESAMEYSGDTLNRMVMQDLVIAYEFTGAFDKAWELIERYVALFPEDTKAQNEYIFLKNRQMKVEEPDTSNE